MRQGLAGRVGFAVVGCLAGALCVGAAPAHAVQKFAATDSMSVARTNAAAVALDSGKVLITGGNDGGAVLASAEVFDPDAGANGEWQTVEPMAQGHQLHTATLLNDNSNPADDEVLVVSGSTAEVYDVSADTWTPTTGSLVTSRISHTATAMADGRVLIAGGGFSGQTGEVYDPTTDSFTAVPGTMTAWHSSGSAALLGDGRVAIGGSFSSNNVDIYDPNTLGGIWRVPGRLGGFREGSTASTLPNGDVLFTGGTGFFTGPASSTDVVLDDTGDGDAGEGPGMTAARLGHTAASLGSGRILFAGGLDDLSATQASAEVYDSSANSFAAVPAMSTPRSAHVAAPLPGNRALVAGGTDGSGNELASAEVFAFVDDPAVAADDAATLAEDAGFTAIDVKANDDDPDDDPFSVESVTQPANGDVNITGGGAGVEYRPDPGYCNTAGADPDDTFTYTITGGDSATVSVEVTCVDDGPVAVDDSATVGEDSAATTIDVRANDADADGGTKQVVNKTNGAHGAVEITNGGADVTFQPAADYCGPDSFTYDLNGGSRATVAVTVTCADDDPVAVDDAATVGEDSAAMAIDVLSNDADADGGTKQVADKTNGAQGTVAITGGGTGLTYEPAANFCGDDSFTYDLNGGSRATVDVEVSCFDDSPVAVDDTATADEDTPKTIDVRANDTDIDGGPRQVAAKTDGAHGAVEITNGGADVRYSPEAEFCGDDSFTYDLNGGSRATVEVDVTCVDDNPVAVNDSVTVAEDSGATTIDVRANDTDIDGGPSQVAAKTDGAHGAVAITGGGTGLTYAPGSDYCGTDSFTYDLNGGSRATVSVTVTCVDDSAPPPPGDGGDGGGGSGDGAGGDGGGGSGDGPEPIPPTQPTDPGVEPAGAPRIDVKGSKGTIELSCERAVPCAGEVEVFGNARRRAARGGGLLAAGDYSLAPGAADEVQLKLTKAGRKALQKKKSVSATALINSADGTTREMRVKLIRKKNKKGRTL